jgi:hypothetical protein
MNREDAFPRTLVDLATIAIYPFEIAGKTLAIVIGTSLALGFWLAIAAIFAVAEALRPRTLRALGVWLLVTLHIAGRAVRHFVFPAPLGRPFPSARKIHDAAVEKYDVH